MNLKIATKSEYDEALKISNHHASLFVQAVHHHADLAPLSAMSICTTSMMHCLAYNGGEENAKQYLRELMTLVFSAGVSAEDFRAAQSKSFSLFEDMQQHFELLNSKAGGRA